MKSFIILVGLLVYVLTDQLSAQCGSACSGYTPASFLPSGASWVPYRFSSGTAISDDNDETPSPMDITFDTVHAPFSVQTASDAVNCFFRIQLTDSPAGPKGFAQFMWMVMLYNQTGTHLATVGVDGNPSGTGNDEIYVCDPNGNNRVTVYTMSGAGSLYGAQISQVPSTTHYYLDFQVPICVLTWVSCTYGASLLPVQSPITDSSPIYLKFGTSTSAQIINKDVAGCTGTNCSLPIASLALTSFSTLQNGALPVELSSFTSRQSDGTVFLTWRTITETNSYGFGVESSPGNEAAWEQRGFVPGQGVSNAPVDYAFTDRPAPGYASTIQYRLKCIDRDGSARYSQTLSMERSAAGGTALTAVYPSPLLSGTSLPTVSFSLEREGTVSLCAYSPLGLRIPIMEASVMPPGSHTMAWDASAITSSGTWFAVLIVDGMKKFIRPFVVL